MLSAMLFLKYMFRFHTWRSNLSMTLPQVSSIAEAKLSKMADKSNE